MPDWLDKTEGILVELKFVNPCQLRAAAQLRDFATYAKSIVQQGGKMDLYLLVRESDKIRPEVALQLKNLGYTVVEIKDFALELLETVKIVN